MNGRNALENYALLAQMLQQQVPQGNPVADYLDGRSMDKTAEAATLGAMSPVVMGTGLGAAATGNIPLGLLMMLGGAANGLGAYQAAGQASDMGTGADMWANRFGNGDPNQGLPGTPSGPAWRR